ncbi:hypothetical protein GCM10011531_16880 [Aquaticitalea lipolytica]|jgi:hypothetical protein|uniref:Lipoprotein n=1 Tax=Aquaticitalea lipolytica TaxID=1247562 RepID=A0A8J2TUK1_9FLAO|nr:hypothetical protein [Aquaticitalea lipolytica]GFZ86211.1 hypothetical protein GCM10011531_16880 [Aquaticitalea lipolytica]
MKKFLLFTVLLSVLVSCSGRKQIEKALHSGNYNQAIQDALKKLENNKDKKRKQDYVMLLEDAYAKANERDLLNIKHLKKDGNPEHYKTIYDLYLNLNARQEAVKAVLPLQINGRDIKIKLNDYTDAIVESREKVSDYMYDKGLDLLESDDKYTIRQAYDVFKYIERINPNYEDTRSLLQEAHERGTEFVIVTIENQTNQIIPRRLEDDLLNFDTYGLNQFWIVYHANSNPQIDYDYAMQLQLKRINISPEELHEKQLLREKQIVDGWKYQLDDAGNVMKDSLGNDIKIDNIVNVRARYFEFNQFKSTQVIANVVYVDLKTNQVLDAFPIDSEFVFENRFATVRGDERALTNEDLNIVRNRRVPFPSNEQMVYDTGEDLKIKLKNIITSYRMRRG